jgi:glycosyltransferase involved in cell wall biosynthesis
MQSMDSPQKFIRIHLTNVTGIGASQLLDSLLPALVQCDDAHVERIYLPETGPLSKFLSLDKNVIIKKYRRFLPIAISRFIECTVLSHEFKGRTPILVMGDLPLRVRARQTLFVQNSHLIVPKSFEWNLNAWKYSISRLVFRINLGRVATFIVQTETMKSALIDSYPSIKSKVKVIPHPIPAWLLKSNHKKPRRKLIRNYHLKLIYPAAGYPHKNHSLLSMIKEKESDQWPIRSLILTIDRQMNPSPTIPWVHCVGFLAPDEMIHAYGDADGLLFLSKKESLGFPLLEAMFLGLPIICPNLPYAKNLCGNQAIYFDPNSSESLQTAILHLGKLLSEDWVPDWSEQLKGIPKTWESFASKILAVTTNSFSID